MTQHQILHICASDYALGITERGNDAGFSNSVFTKFLQAMGWTKGQGWCNYWANSVWWRAYAPSLNNDLRNALRAFLDALPHEKNSIVAFATKIYLRPLHDLGLQTLWRAEIDSVHRERLRGALVIFDVADDDDTQEGTDDHIGICAEYVPEQGKMLCYEGNAADALRMTWRPVDEKIVGFILPLATYPEW
jgi:hypothetical protein